MKKHLLWFTCVLLGISANAQLSGTYSIGGESPDYDSIVNAVADIVAQGVDGPVIFELRSGVYEEGTIIIDSIPGTTRDNTVTFKSESGIADSVTIGNDDDILELNDAAWIHLENLSFNCYVTQAKAINFQKGCHGFQVTGCSFELAFQAIGIFRDEPTTGEFASDTIVIRGNTFNKGRSAIYIKNANSKYCDFGVIEDNVINEFYSYGIFLQHFGRKYDEQGNFVIADGGVSVKRNLVKTSRAVNATGVQLVYVAPNVEVAYNDIQVIGTGNQTGLHQSNSNGTAINKLKWYNNFVYVSGTQTTYGLHMQNGYYNDYTNNTVIVDPKGSASYVNYYANSGSHNHLNNIYVNLGSLESDWLIRHRAEQDPKNVVLTSDYNLFYTAGPNFAQWKGDTITSFDQHNDSLLLDANSVSELAGGFYMSAGKIALCSAPSITGTPVTYVFEDIYGQTRDAVNPKIGAVEFTMTGQPVVQLLASANNACGSLTTDVSVDGDGLVGGWYSWSFNEDDLGIDSESDEIQTEEDGYVLMDWGFADCSIKDSIKLTVNALPEVMFSGDTEFCTGETAQFTVSSNVALDQTIWGSGETSDTDVSSTSETVTVSIRDAATQCENSGELEIAELEAPLPVITDDAGVLTSSEEGVSYSWTKDNALLPNDTLSSVEVTSAGAFVVTVEYLNECIRSSESYDATTIVGLEKLLDQGIGAIYPNPVSDQLNLDFDFDASYTLINSTGETAASGSNKVLNVSDYPSGIYILQVFRGTDFIGATKVTVE